MLAKKLLQIEKITCNCNYNNFTSFFLKTPGMKSEAHGMYSSEGEYVPFKTNVLLDGQVEFWLLEVEKAMRSQYCLNEQCNCITKSTCSVKLLTYIYSILTPVIHTFMNIYCKFIYCKFIYCKFMYFIYCIL